MPGIRRALILTTAERYFTLAVNFVALAIVSRLLTPEEIGISVVGTSLAAMAYSAQEFAASSYLIQQTNLTREDIRGAFTVMLLLNILISASLCLLAPVAASIYGQQGLEIYLKVIAVTCLIEVFAMPLIALLKRDMQFQKVAIFNATQATLLASCTIGFVHLGLSYMSFAWAGLLAASCCGLLAVILRPDLWIYRPILQRWRGMLRFGGYNGVNIALYRLYELLPYIILGRILAFDATALYNRAITICQIPDKLILGGAVSVFLPALSQEVHAGRSLKDPYLHTIEYITGFQWPALLLLAIFADPVVHVLFGPQWGESVPIVQIIAVASLMSFTAELNYPVLVALDAMRDTFIRALISWPLSAVIITAAAFAGIHAVALSFFLVVPLQAYIALTFIRRHLEISWYDLVYALRKSAMLSALCALGAGIVVILCDAHQILNPLVILIFGGFFSCIFWIAGLWITEHPIFGELIRFSGVVRTILRGHTATY